MLMDICLIKQENICMSFVPTLPWLGRIYGEYIGRRSSFHFHRDKNVPIAFGVPLLTINKLCNMRDHAAKYAKQHPNQHGLQLVMSSPGQQQLAPERNACNAWHPRWSLLRTRGAGLAQGLPNSQGQGAGGGHPTSTRWLVPPEMHQTVHPFRQA